MSNISPVVEKDTPNMKIVTWSPVALGDVCYPFVVATYAEKSVQVTGTFGGGGSVNIEGSNDPGGSPLYNLLEDPWDHDLVIAASVLERIVENPYMIRPRITAGDGTTSLSIRLTIHTVTKP